MLSKFNNAELKKGSRDYCPLFFSENYTKHYFTYEANLLVKYAII